MTNEHIIEWKYLADWEKWNLWIDGYLAGSVDDYGSGEFGAHIGTFQHIFPRAAGLDAVKETVESGAVQITEAYQSWVANEPA